VGLLGPDSGKTSVNGVSITASSTATTLPFGNVDSTASSTVGHSLAVITNASNGFIVTVQQTDEMKNAANNSINSFDNSPEDTGSSTQAYPWSGPRGILGQDFTYGHMGLTSDDTSNTGGLDFTTTPSYYAGLNEVDTMQIMYHDGVAAGTTQNQGLAAVAYTLEVSDLQEAGDYTSTLTYVCTPTY
jgi:hypothetical protein